MADIRYHGGGALDAVPIRYHGGGALAADLARYHGDRDNAGRPSSDFWQRLHRSDALWQAWSGAETS